MSAMSEAYWCAFFRTTLEIIADTGDPLAKRALQKWAKAQPDSASSDALLAGASGDLARPIGGAVRTASREEAETHSVHVHVLARRRGLMVARDADNSENGSQLG